MIGIEIKWECQDCGNILINLGTVETKLIRIRIPDRCNCGNRTRYKIKEFKQVELTKKDELKKEEEEKGGLKIE